MSRALDFTAFPAEMTRESGHFGGHLVPVVDISFTAYFESVVMRRRPYLKKEWCVRVLDNPHRSEPQEHNRHRFWAQIEELDGRFLRVVTLADKVTVHNAFPDRRFRP